LKEVQPENTKAAMKVNGTVLNMKIVVEPDESQTTISNHPVEGTVEDVSGWPEWYTKEQPEVVGTSIHPPPLKKDKIQISRSPHNKPAAKKNSTAYHKCGTGRTRPVGLYRKDQVLGPQYSRHRQVSGTCKEGIHGDSGTNPFGEPIDQSLQWATRLEKTGILGLLDLPHFGRGHHTTTCFK
jgi:hypothetical protein